MLPGMASKKPFCPLLVYLLQFSTWLSSWGHGHMSCLESLFPSPITSFCLAEASWDCGRWSHARLQWWARGRVCTCVKARRSHLTRHLSVYHIVSLFIVQGQSNVCYLGSCGKEPILQNAPSTGGACFRTTSDKHRSKVLASLVCN